jgi:hypothetical protein
MESPFANVVAGLRTPIIKRLCTVDFCFSYSTILSDDDGVPLGLLQIFNGQGVMELIRKKKE